MRSPKASAGSALLTTSSRDNLLPQQRGANQSPAPRQGPAEAEGGSRAGSSRMAIASPAGKPQGWAAGARHQRGPLGSKSGAQPPTKKGQFAGSRAPSYRQPTPGARPPRLLTPEQPGPEKPGGLLGSRSRKVGPGVLSTAHAPVPAGAPCGVPACVSVSLRARVCV